MKALMEKQQNNVTIIRAYKARTISGQSINGPIHRKHPLFALQQQQAHSHKGIVLLTVQPCKG